MSGFAPLMYVLLALGIILGLVKPRRLGRFAAGLVIGPVLASIALTAGNELFASLSLVQKILAVVLVLIIGVPMLLWVVLPRDIWAGVVSGFLYDVLKSIFMLPVRLIGWAYYFIKRRALR